MKFFVSCAKGLEYLLADELLALGVPKATATIAGVNADGFGLARPSNTTPVVVLRFEADNAVALERIQAGFRQAISAVWPGIQLPF